jgi:hypothetical protein
MEQLNVVIFGCGHQASFIRTVITTFLNLLIALLVALQNRAYIMNIVLGLLALMKIFNLLISIGLEKALE